MSRLQDYTGSYVRFTGACDAGYLKDTLIVSEARWDHWGEEWRVRGSGNLSDWLPAELFEVVDKPDDADLPTLSQVLPTLSQVLPSLSPTRETL